MTPLPLYQIDAFADRPFTGNPAAVVPLDHWLDDHLLQQIAMENNLSETAFLVPDKSAKADYELRWFTPTTEVRLCGHATLASGHYVLGSDAALSEVRFRTRQSGVLTVARSETGYTMSLPAWEATRAAMPGTVAALGLDHAVESLRHAASGYTLIIVDRESEVRNLRPDFRALGELDDVVVIVSAQGSAADVVSRAFACGAGIDEDPVTGSAHAVLTPYWTAKLGREHFTAYQASARGGWLGCTLDGDRVILEGRCVTVIEGSLLLA
ncbi:PhzF family phenazine biosynthesis protein [Stakelama sediminis]|uniref:PhzF family phenazine biosynthesis protein n=1 Tax=Stakelama sediminis TaxID=463200 RepID=A0A840YXZ6_9SPHN|nr:PhzF family phenazine biosynthesis protein [Stakelama sediminis]MBB5718394.1 PhzF family phenazine biosynthesis protein [Stakelama sediminis]